MSVLNYTRLAQKYKWHWNRKLLSLSGSVPLKVSRMRALVLLVLVIGTGSLIRIKCVSKLAEYFGQLFISIIAPTEFGPWASRRCRSISCIIVSNRISRSILPIRIVVCRDDTWARNRWNYLARLNCTGRRSWRWMASLVNSSWVSWHIWWISHLVTETQDRIEGCPKQ